MELGILVKDYDLGLGIEDKYQGIRNYGIDIAVEMRDYVLGLRLRDIV